MSEKKYVKGLFANERVTNFGSLLNIDFKADEFIQWVKENTNDKGYCKITVMKAKDGGKNSHYAVLNDWKPTDKPFAKPSNVAPINEFDNELPF